MRENGWRGNTNGAESDRHVHVLEPQLIHICIMCPPPVRVPPWPVVAMVVVLPTFLLHVPAALARTFHTIDIHFSSSDSNIQGLVEVDLGNPYQALLVFEEALGLRQALFAKDDWTGVALSNVGLACMESGAVDRAMEYHQKALALRRQINCRMLDDSLANLAALLLRMGKPDETEKM